MRLWSLHPMILDRQGLLGAWREALGAKKCLEAYERGEKVGYQAHTALLRFKQHSMPVNAINVLLWTLYRESQRRGYNFDRSKISWDRLSIDKTIPVTVGQAEYELSFLAHKINSRSNRKLDIDMLNNNFPINFDLFHLVEGEIEDWEKVKTF